MKSFYHSDILGWTSSFSEIRNYRMCIAFEMTYRSVNNCLIVNQEDNIFRGCRSTSIVDWNYKSFYGKDRALNVPITSQNSFYPMYVAVLSTTYGFRLLLPYSNKHPLSNKRPLRLFMGKRWPNAIQHGFRILIFFCIFAHIFFSKMTFLD